jgi:hypothetical protein
MLHLGTSFAHGVHPASRSLCSHAAAHAEKRSEAANNLQQSLSLLTCPHTGNLKMLLAPSTPWRHVAV